MQYVLMHKQAEVALLELNEATGWIQKIREVCAPAHLPIGVTVRKGVADRASLNTWWTDRAIPAYRIGMKSALEAFGIETPAALSMRCHGLSLSDAYWLKAEGSGLRWEDVNFFCHPFSEDVGDILFGVRKNDGLLDFVSPDNTTDGFLKKRWTAKEGKRYLVKGGSSPFFQQPFNEVIASEIMTRLGIPHVAYSLIWSEGAPYSVCEDFLDENTELIPAWRVMMIRKKSNGTSVYQHFLNCCEALGVGDAAPFLDRMITMDYIIANEDRHFNNFGLLRSADTLDWIGMAPIYDSGSCLGYDKTPADIRTEKGVICKPFKNHHTEQLRLVQAFDWLDLSTLDDVEQMIGSIFAQDMTGAYVDAGRASAVARSVRRRIERLASIVTQRRSNRWRTVCYPRKMTWKRTLPQIMLPVRAQKGKCMIEIKGTYNTAIVYADSVDQSVRGQLTALCNSPAMDGAQIRVMPDVHAGSWVIGTTVRFKDKIIPSLIGTDIGCGVLRLPFENKGKPDFDKLDKVIRESVPSGRSIRKMPHRFASRIDLSELRCAKHIRMEKALLSIGTLGGGNHFIEVAEGNHLLIHTGSRHLGAEVAKWYQEAAFAAQNEDSSYQLAWIDGALMDDYVHDVAILAAYAEQNRLAIADEICSAMRWRMNEEQAEDTPHNYICREDGWLVLRKGAISARKGSRPTIPMNMRDGSLICRGLANEEWNCSAPHGAGRLYSRSEVKSHFTLTQYKQAMKGIHSPSVDRRTLDECPMAYKPMEEIIAGIAPAVEIEKIIRPLYNFKAGEED